METGSKDPKINRSPSQCPGTARSSTSAGRPEIMTMSPDLALGRGGSSLGASRGPSGTQPAPQLLVLRSTIRPTDSLTSPNDLVRAFIGMAKSGFRQGRSLDSQCRTSRQVVDQSQLFDQILGVEHGEGAVADQQVASLR